MIFHMSFPPSLSTQIQEIMILDFKFTPSKNCALFIALLLTNIKASNPSIVIYYLGMIVDSLYRCHLSTSTSRHVFDYISATQKQLSYPISTPTILWLLLPFNIIKYHNWDSDSLPFVKEASFMVINLFMGSI